MRQISQGRRIWLDECLIASELELGSIRCKKIYGTVTVPRKQKTANCEPSLSHSNTRRKLALSQVNKEKEQLPSHINPYPANVENTVSS